MIKINKTMDQPSMKDLFDIELPEEANLQLAPPSTVQYYKDYSERIIWIDSEINDGLLQSIRQIYTWNLEDEKNNIPVNERKPIKIFIYSYGGDGNICLSFIDAMNASKTKIIAICAGVAMSAAGMIFISAPKGSRYMTKNSTILLHQGSGEVSGSASALLEQSDDYRHFLNTMKDIVLNNTEITKQLYAKMAKKEWYIYSDKAIELGCADHVIENITDVIF